MASIATNPQSSKGTNSTLVADKDAAALEAWCAMDVLDDLVNALDPYRSRDYWEAVRTEDDSADPATLEWKQIEEKLCH